MPTDDLEQARLDIERQRLDLDRSKAEREKSFLRINSGILISAAVSLAAIVVSIAQVWVTKISKDKELQIVSIQKKSELDLQEKEKERELSVLEAQKKREWDLNAAKFITDNRRAIFNGTTEEQRLFAKIIGSIYPPEISASLLERIERASPPAAKKTWREARTAIGQASTSPNTIANFHIHPPGSVADPDAERVTLSPDGKYVAQLLNGKATVFDISGKLLMTINHDAPIDVVDFSLDGNIIVHATDGWQTSLKLPRR